MKIRIRKNELMNGINVVQKAVLSRSNMSILKGILIVAENDHIRLVSNNMELGIEITMDGEVLESGSVVIDCKTLADIVRKIRDEYIEMMIDRDFKITVNCKDLKINLFGYHSVDFPELPAVKEDDYIFISQNLLSSMIRQTIFAVSKAEHLRAITGVLIEIYKNEIIMAATDGYRFALRKYYDKGLRNKEAKVIVPGNCLLEIEKLFNKESEKKPVKIYFQERYTVIHTGKAKIVTRLLQGNFINHNSVMPQNYETEIEINTADLIYALEIVSIFALNSNTGVIFDISADKLKITSKGEIGNIIKEVRIKLTGRELVIAFNISYILDMLRVIDEKQIKICFSKGSNSPAVIKPVSDISYEYLVLPIRINNIQGLD